MKIWNRFIHEIKGWLSMSRFWEGLIPFRFVLHQTWARHKIRGSKYFPMWRRHENFREFTPKGWGLLPETGEQISSWDKKNTLLTSMCQRKCVFSVGIHNINTFTGFGIERRLPSSWYWALVIALNLLTKFVNAFISPQPQLRPRWIIGARATDIGNYLPNPYSQIYPKYNILPVYITSIKKHTCIDTGRNI